jgi:hypothetical protein
MGDIDMIMRLAIPLLMLGSTLSAIGPAAAADLGPCTRPCREPLMAFQRHRSHPVEPYFIVDQGPNYSGPNIRTWPTIETRGRRMAYPNVDRHDTGGWYWQPPSSVYWHLPRTSMVPADTDD